MIYCLEDDNSIRELIVYTLEVSGFEVKGFEDYESFNEALKQEKPELILLDIMLGDKDGIEILKELKADSSFQDIPIILETAKTSEFDKVNGLDLGADDYLAKPFGMMEMVSRVKAVLRRSNMSHKQIVSYKEIEIDRLRRVCKVNNEVVDLTLKEYELLLFLLDNKEIVFSREQLLKQIWGHNFLGESRTIDVHIGTLRNKLKDCKEYIKTIHGVGYCFTDNNG